MIDDSFYENYGCSLATRLVAIAHTESSCSYIFVDDMGLPVEVQSAINAGKVTEDRTVLVFESPYEDLDNGGRDNYHARWKGSLAVLQKTSAQQSIRQVRQQCRRILLSVLALMLDDADRGQLYDEAISVDVRDLPLERIGPVVSNWYGYGLEFTWIVPIDLDLNPDDLLPTDAA